MKTRTLVAAALALGLAALPAEAGLFGKKSEKKKLPKPTTSEQRMGHYPVQPERPKPDKKLNSRAGSEQLRRHQGLPVIISHPWVRGQ